MLINLSVKQKCSENMTLKIETMYMQLQKVIKNILSCYGYTVENRQNII